MFCTRLANGGLFPTGDPIVPFVISPRFECLNKRTHTHTHIYTALRSLLFTTRWSAMLSAPCDQHSLKQEFHHINTSLQLNGYQHFNFNQPNPSLPPEERPQFKSTIAIPYIGHTSHKLQRIFSQAQIKIFHTAPNKI